MLNEVIIREQLEETFKPLTFDEKKHLYYWDGIRVPISVSGLVSKHSDPFDREKWLKVCANKEKVSIEELGNRWDNERDVACATGTKTHSFLEHYRGVETPTSALERAGMEFFRDLDGGRYKLIKRELRVVSLKYSFAGTLDLPLWDRETQSIVVGDWKTNKDLFKGYGYMRPPFDYLESHPYNKYQLQLSYYQLALEEWGYKVSDRLLIYLKRDGTYEVDHLYDFAEDLRGFLN